MIQERENQRAMEQAQRAIADIMAKGADAERARIREMVLKKRMLIREEGGYSTGYSHALRDLAAMLNDAGEPRG